MSDKILVNLKGKGETAKDALRRKKQLAKRADKLGITMAQLIRNLIDVYATGL